MPAGACVMIAMKIRASCMLLRSIKNNEILVHMSSIQSISTNKAPQAIGPYVQANVYENFIFTSGQIPLDATTGEVVGATVEEQTQCVLENMKAVLSAAHASLECVIKTTCFLSDMAHFQAFNEVYARYFVASKPARSCVAVRSLPKNVLVEIEAIAIRNS